VFTGIIRELGRVTVATPAAGGLRLEVDAPLTAPLTAVGDSVSVNGSCLTAVSLSTTTIAFDAVPETLARTTTGRLTPGMLVNLEPALRAGEPLGGHIVQGHVDGVATVVGIEGEGEGARLRAEVPPELLRYVVEKGSLTLDGVSLTVASLDERGFTVALIPHTLAVTTLGALREGALLNLELDVMAKYVERLLPRGSL
jgi:riboflavin synthase